MKHIFKKSICYLSVLLSVVLVATSLVGCGASQANKFGNIIGNINGNGGIATKQGEWIYYSTLSGMYKTKNNQTPQKLYDKEAEYLNVSGDWLYFCDAETHEVYKMKTNGTGLELLIENAGYLFYADGWLYYTDISSRLRRIKPDKSQESVIIDDSVIRINITDDKIYCMTMDGLCICNLDGSDPIIKSTYANTQAMIIYEDYLYATGTITKLSVNDVFDDPVDQVTVAPSGTLITIENDWLYYNNMWGDKCIYKVKTDGTQLQKLNDIKSGNIGVVGDWIYYSSAKLNEYYKMRIDGSDNQLLE